MKHKSFWMIFTSIWGANKLKIHQDNLGELPTGSLAVPRGLEGFLEILGCACGFLGIPGVSADPRSAVGLAVASWGS